MKTDRPGKWNPAWGEFLLLVTEVLTTSAEVILRVT